ncbi:MAG: hypothetical protein ACRDQH_05960, partial [Pseudonocardiaceae bacterium]
DLAVTYFDVASAAVRQPAGVPIVQATSTVKLMGKPGRWLPLPGPPVTAVSAVELDGEAITDARLISDQLWRANGWMAICGEPSEVTVTQTHGLSEAPADIVDLVCRLVAAALVAWRSQPAGEGLAATGNKVQESLGDYAVTYGSDGRITEMTLPESIRRQLAARFGGGVAVIGSR